MTTPKMLEKTMEMTTKNEGSSTKDINIGSNNDLDKNQEERPEIAKEIEERETMVMTTSRSTMEPKTQMKSREDDQQGEVPVGSIEKEKRDRTMRLVSREDKRKKENNDENVPTHCQLEKIMTEDFEEICENLEEILTTCRNLPESTGSTEMNIEVERTLEYWKHVQNHRISKIEKWEEFDFLEIRKFIYADFYERKLFEEFLQIPWREDVKIDRNSEYWYSEIQGTVEIPCHVEIPSEQKIELRTRGKTSSGTVGVKSESSQNYQIETVIQKPLSTVEDNLNIIKFAQSGHNEECDDFYFL